MKTPIIISNPETAITLTAEQAQSLGINISKDMQHGELKTVGMWNIPVSYKAICMSATYALESYTTECTEKVIYGMRTLTNIRQGGYELEGYVSINGKKYSAFTSSQLFEIEGKLIDVAVIHVRIK